MPCQNVLWVGGVHADAIAANRVQQTLGQEFGAVVYNAYAGFDADAFAAVSGTIRGGGLCFLLTPPLMQWPQFDDPVYQRLFSSESDVHGINSAFLQRFINIARQQPNVFCIEEGQALPNLNISNFSTEIAQCKAFLNLADQAKATEAILNVVTGHRRRPLVLTADRGRGKSAALGIAAANMLKQGVQRVLVTAPRLDAVNSLFKHARNILSDGVLEQGRLYFGESVIEYIPPDVLIDQQQIADCLMIDEAAALPNAMLEKLLQRYSRLVFATTVHGYEGTGRGFALRFFKTLDQHTPDWNLLTLQQPIRWSEHDPLEDFIFRGLLLNSDISTTLNPETRDRSVIEIVRGDELVKDEAKLNQVFGLLVLAHYRTRPNDLRQLLDSAELTIFVSRIDDIILGVALVLNEGILDKKTEHAVYLGERRLRGHLLAQTLLAHLGLNEVNDLKFARIMRIAVHPEFQRRGIGGQLISKIAEQIHSDYDIVGVSFGLTEQLMRFWQRAGFEFVRVGLTREHTAGCHSGVALKALSNKGSECVSRARQRFFKSWPYLLRGPLCDLTPGLVAKLSVHTNDVRPLNLSEDERREVEAFAYAYRGYEMSMPVLDKLTWQVLASTSLSSVLNDNALALLVGKVIQNKSWSQLARQLGYSGKQQTIDALKNVFKLFLM
jgi:tRNA(Met) cytidine acetyltransferase